MENNICSKCGTENEPQYIYCKNCGLPLNIKQPEPAPAPEQATYTAVPPAQSGYIPNGICIDGIPTDDMAVFIGKKHQNIMPKFIKMEFSGSKISWCWPTAILGYLFGPMGAALWYFYRKMNKKALLLTVLGALITVMISVIDGFIDPNLYETVENALSSGDFYAVYDSITSISPYDLALIMASYTIESITHILTLILCGIFGFNSYKNHCTEKIREFKAYNQNNPYYRFGLAAAGGVSGGMLALGIVILIVVNNISSIISSLLAFLPSL